MPVNKEMLNKELSTYQIQHKVKPEKNNLKNKFFLKYAFISYQYKILSKLKKK